MSFASPLWLLALPLVLLPLWPRQQSSRLTSSLIPLSALPKSWRVQLLRLQPPLAVLTLLLLILALAGAQRVKKEEQALRQGIDVMLTLDVSASLGARDIAPDRLSVARNTAADFLAQRQNDRIGVILFAGVPTLLSPPVLDKGPLLQQLRQLKPDRLGSGTALGDALAAALDRLKDSDAASKVVILLTDGASNRGRVTPHTAALAAAALGVRVYTIGFGSDQGGEVPLDGTGRIARLDDGTPLLSALEEEPLREMARLSGGRYFRASSADLLRQVYAKIDALETSPLQIREIATEIPYRPILLTVCAVLLLIDLLLFRLLLRLQPTGFGSQLTSAATLIALILLLLPEKVSAPYGESSGPPLTLALALDTSASMATKEEGTSRLERAKTLIETLLQRLPQAQMALLPFAGEAMLQVPLTREHDALRYFLNRLQPRSLDAPGSAPEEALRAAAHLLENVAGERMILLFSDGERTLAAEPPTIPPGVTIHTLPLGRHPGPLVDGNGTPLLGPDGTPLQSLPDPERLQRLATASGGLFLADANGLPTLKPLLEQLARQAPPAAPLSGMWLILPLFLLLVRHLPWRRRTSSLLAVAIALVACSQETAPGPTTFHRAETLVTTQPGSAIDTFAIAASFLQGERRGVALYNQGSLLLQQEEPAAARSVLEEALRLLPGDPDVRNNLLIALSSAPPENGSIGNKQRGEDDAEGGGESLSHDEALQLLDALRPDLDAPASDRQERFTPVVLKEW
ncbi:MAG: hypothetical protein C0621_02970 [Desulfuromonas sp.]|nr:MAG: hypothetical protein C0621_02970 [Desulfuromonas sp.]